MVSIISLMLSPNPCPFCHAMLHNFNFWKNA
uniref:Uncharacterized protein n=1 Tax=Rhizophora mucronata TaxID=61149 RepID=A0A2P2PVN2_RHIMU